MAADSVWCSEALRYAPELVADGEGEAGDLRRVSSHNAIKLDVQPPKKHGPAWRAHRGLSSAVGDYAARECRRDRSGRNWTHVYVPGVLSAQRGWR